MQNTAHNKVISSILALILTCIFQLPVLAQEQPDTLQEDTLAKEIHASLIIADPGDILYSCVGHCAIHMKAPEYDLDYVFSYEAEDVRHKILTFLAGNLKMGMLAVPFKEYLSFYENDGRGVREYTLNLPLEVKRNLWRVLDEHVMQGANLPYDYVVRGCAHSTLMMLKEGLDTIPLEYCQWPETFKTMNRRELTALQIKESPWNWAFLYILTNGPVDYDCSYEEKVVMPADLVEVLSHAKVQGQPLMDSKPTQLLPSKYIQKASWCTPLLVSLLLLILALLTIYPKFPPYGGGLGRGILLILQFLIGALTTYLVCFSKLCCTEWSWLIIPFNPLPLIFWKWRKHWLLPYSIVIAAWAAFMTFWPHLMTDWSLIVLSVAIVAIYISEYLSVKHPPQSKDKNN